MLWPTLLSQMSVRFLYFVALCLFVSLLSTVMGHCCYCVCRCGAGGLVLFLHLQKVDFQEEEGQEGQRQRQKCYQHERCHRWCENRGKNFVTAVVFSLQFCTQIHPRWTITFYYWTITLFTVTYYYIDDNIIITELLFWSSWSRLHSNDKCMW